MNDIEISTIEVDENVPEFIESPLSNLKMFLMLVCGN